jgi:hypothetical protein
MKILTTNMQEFSGFISRASSFPHKNVKESYIVIYSLYFLEHHYLSTFNCCTMQLVMKDFQVLTYIQQDLILHDLLDAL